MIWERIICLLIGYVFGLFQTSYIYGKLNHVDIREYGSGNAGTTNAMRILGKKAGVITYIGDSFKAVFAALAVYLIYSDSCEKILFVLLMYTGFGVMLGHNFPFYMGFKGGKGIAAASGAIFGLMDWKLVVLAFVTFVVVTYFSKYVSLGSLCMMFGFFVEIVIFGQLNMLHNADPSERLEIYVIAFLMMAMAFYKHRGNIMRLLQGTERKIGANKEANNG